MHARAHARADVDGIGSTRCEAVSWPSSCCALANTTRTDVYAPDVERRGSHALHARARAPTSIEAACANTTHTTPRQSAPMRRRCLPCPRWCVRVHARLASMRNNPRAMTTVGVQHARQHALTSRPRAYASMSIVNNVRDVAAVRTGTRTDWRRGNCNVMSRRRRRALRARRHKPASTWVAQQF